MASSDVSICLTADLTATFFHLRALRSNVGREATHSLVLHSLNRRV